MYRSEFTKRWDPLNGFNETEAMDKKQKVDEAHGVGTTTSQWKPSEIVPDPSKPNGGYKVVICTKV